MQGKGIYILFFLIKHPYLDRNSPISYRFADIKRLQSKIGAFAGALTAQFAIESFLRIHADQSLTHGIPDKVSTVVYIQLIHYFRPVTLGCL